MKYHYGIAQQTGSGSVELVDDSIRFVDRYGTNEMALGDITRIELRDAATGGPQMQGNATLRREMEGVQVEVVSGSAAKPQSTDLLAKELLIRAAGKRLVIPMTQAFGDSPQDFETFARELHKQIQQCNAAVEYRGGNASAALGGYAVGGVLCLFAVAIGFLGVITGIAFISAFALIPLVGAVLLIRTVMRRYKPVNYDPLAIPDALFK